MPLPTVLFTFDEHKEAATEAFGIMATYGLAGTYFVTPSKIDTAYGPATGTLVAMKENNWELGVYSGTYSPSPGVDWNMVQWEASNRINVNNRFRDLKADMLARGLPVTSMAPNQRAWSLPLSRMVEGVYTHVRVADEMRSSTGQWGQFPISNLRYIRGGGTASLSSTDTAASLIAQVDDLISLGGYWQIVIHRVSDDGLEPLYTVNKTIFAALCAKVQTEITAGNLQALRVRDL